ncbi:hypothetical protein TA05_10275 [Citrobacter rodentium]|nr:hypothetical protein TA05_10275 [Citrobacter rodentium]
MLERYQRYLFQYRKANGKPLSTRTQRTALQPLQVWFRWMTKQNLILANPAADLELPRLEKRLPHHILSVEEVEQVLALRASPRPRPNPAASGFGGSTPALPVRMESRLPCA